MEDHDGHGRPPRSSSFMPSIGTTFAGDYWPLTTVIAEATTPNWLDRGASFDPRASSRRVIGIDVDIRAHNHREIEKHPLSGMIDLVEGSSIDAGIVSSIKDRAR